MPGEHSLVAELGGSHDTVKEALRLLEQEGLLINQGPGKRRLIAAASPAKTGLNVQLLLYEPNDSGTRQILELWRLLEASGHHFSFTAKSLVDLKQNPERVVKMVQDGLSDVCVIQSASADVLKALLTAKQPIFSFYGDMRELPVPGAGAELYSTLRAALRRLFEFGHQRIVMLGYAERRKPRLALFEQIFLEELQQQGIAGGAYNLPDWEETPEGLSRCLRDLFAFTPPSAILVNDSVLYLAVKNFLAHERGQELRKVTVISTDYHATFDWCHPPVPHFRWDHQKVVRNVVRWVDRYAAGKRGDQRQTFATAEFVGAELLGPPLR